MAALISYHLFLHRRCRMARLLHRILEAPSVFDLMLGLFDRKNLTFKINGFQFPLDVEVYSIERDVCLDPIHGWCVSGYVKEPVAPGRYKRSVFLASYRTDTREGYFAITKERDFRPKQHVLSQE